MYGKEDKSDQDRSMSATNSLAETVINTNQSLSLIDNRPAAQLQRKLQHIADQRIHSLQLKVIQATNNTGITSEVIQKCGFCFDDRCDATSEKDCAYNQELEAQDEYKQEDDGEWDPADYAEDPLDPDDILSSSVRKSLSFTSAAKDNMKADTPKNHKGEYVCHICGGTINKGDEVDMDHLPPWKERLASFIKVEGITESNADDELSGPNMKLLYNMRGSVFAHSACNRSHKGEGNYKDKWGSSDAWYKAGGGSPF